MGFSLRNFVKGIYDDADQAVGGRLPGQRTTPQRRPAPPPQRRPAPRPASTAQPQLQVRQQQGPQLSMAAPQRQQMQQRVIQAPKPIMQPTVVQAPQQQLLSGNQFVNRSPQARAGARGMRPPSTLEQISNKLNTVQTTMERNPVVLGSQRVASSLGQGASGLYDLVTPGEGRSRASQVYSQEAEKFDQLAKQNEVNQGIYRGTQVVGEIGTLAAGAGIAKGVGNAVPFVGKAANAIDARVARATTGLIDGNRKQQLAGNAIRGMANTRWQGANVGYGGYEAGKETARGGDGGDMFATNMAIGTALPVVGSAVKMAAKPVIGAAAKPLRSANIMAPSRLNPDEVADLSRFADEARSGAIMADDTYARGVQAAQKAGVDYRDPKAVGDLIGAHMNYATVAAGRREATTRLLKPQALNEGGIGMVTDDTGSTIPTLRKLAGKPKQPPKLSPKDEIQAINNRAYKSRGGKLTISEEKRIQELQGQATTNRFDPSKPVDINNKPVTVDDYVAAGTSKPQAEKIVKTKEVVRELSKDWNGRKVNDGMNLDKLVIEDNRLNKSLPGIERVKEVQGYKDITGVGRDGKGTYRRPTVVTEIVDDVDSSTASSATKQQQPTQASPAQQAGRNLDRSYADSITPQNKRTIAAYNTDKPVTDFKTGETVTMATPQGGTVNGKIVKTPDFTQDLRIKGNDFQVKLADGRTIKTSGADFESAKPNTAAGAAQKQAPVSQRAAQPPIVGTALKGTSSANVNTKASRFANKTVQGSDELSQPLKSSVKQAKPDYTPTTNEARIAKSDALLSKGKKKAYTDVNERLNAKDVDDQTVSDAIAVIKDLDSKPGQASLQQATDLIDKLSEKLSNAGKTVQAASILANRTPEGLRYHAQKQLKNAGVKLTPDTQKQLKGYTDTVKKTEANLAQKQRALARAEGTPNAPDARAAMKEAEEAVSIARDNVQYFVAKQMPTSTSDKIVNFWRAGLLTAPTTTGGAGIGNAAMTLTRKLWVNPTATMLDAAMSIGTGKRTYMLAKQGEWGKGVKRGAKNATSGQFWKTGYDPMSPFAGPNSTGASRSINYGDGRLGQATGKYVNGVYKLMGAADQPFRYGAHDEILSSMAKADAYNKGLRGADADKYVADAIQNPSKDLQTRATTEAMGATFQNDTALATMVQSLKGGLKQKGYNKTASLVDFFIPFSGVPSAVADRAIRHSGIKAAKEVTKAVFRATKGEKLSVKQQRELAQYMAEGTIGLPVVAAGFALAEAGLFNGAYPKDAKERQKWTDENRQENSVRIRTGTDKEGKPIYRWVSLNYIQPFGVLLSIGAGINQTEGEDNQKAKVADYVKNGAGSALTSFMGQSYLEGIQGPINALNDPEQELGRYVASATSSAVPNFIRSAARAADDKTRDASGMFDGIKGGLPGLRKQLPAKVGSDGQEIANKDNFFNMYVNPTKPSIARNNNPVVAETSRLLDVDKGVSAAPVKKLEYGDEVVRLDKQQQNDYNKRLGQLRNKQWSALMNTPEYKRLDDAGKKRALERSASDVNAVVKREYAAKNQVGPYSPTYAGKETKLTANQVAIAQGKSSPTKYTSSSQSSGSTTTLASGISPHSKKVLSEYDTLDSATRTKKIREEPSYEWKVEKSQLENDIASGKLSGPQRVKREKAVAKLDVGKKYSKEARELWGMNKGDVLDYVTKAENGQKLAEELIAYDRALYEAGFAKYATFKNGIAPVGRGGSKTASKGRSSGGSRKTGKGSRGGKTGPAIDFASAFASINKLGSSNQSAVRDIVKKKRITRKKARVA